MRIIIGVLIAFMIFSSCKKNDDNCQPETKDGIIQVDKSIVEKLDTSNLTLYYEVEEGDMLLFKYSHDGYQCEDINDDEWGETLTFVIPKGLESFEYKGEEIETLNSFYAQYGAWFSGRHMKPMHGILSGKKTSSTQWEVTASLFLKNKNGDDGFVAFTQEFTVK